MPKFLYILVLTGMWVLNSYAQNPDIKRTWHWYFGAGAGLDFSSGTAVADTTGKLHAKEGCATISDINGNLLFYTDGDTIWDRTHSPMPNGTGLASYLCSLENSSIQGVLIVPNPSDSMQYYVITSDCLENFHQDGYRYSVVDMRLNGGLGDVLYNKKRVLLFSPSTEALSAIKSINNSWWVITHELNNNKFVIIKIDSAGIHLFKSQSIGNSIKLGDIGKFVFSKNGKFLLSSFDIVSPDFTNVWNELFLFDKSSASIEHLCYLWVYGTGIQAEFSHDSKYLFYTNSGNMIYYYTLCSEDTQEIQKSFKILLQDSLNLGNNSLIGLQAGPDNKIYISGDFVDKLSYVYISNDTINYNLLSINLYRNSRQQLPNISHYLINMNTNSCKDNVLNYELNGNLLLVPNIFTPNADNINDYFSIQIAGYKNIAYFIYNRWGTLIHQGQKELQPEIKTEEKLWDGRTSAGEKVSNGVYYYILNLTNTKNETETQKGYIQLLR